MSVRNFWIDADIDGRQTMLGGGPRSSDGGMDVTIYHISAMKVVSKLLLE